VLSKVEVIAKRMTGRGPIFEMPSAGPSLRCYAESLGDNAASRAADALYRFLRHTAEIKTDPVTIIHEDLDALFDRRRCLEFNGSLVSERRPILDNAVHIFAECLAYDQLPKPGRSKRGDALFQAIGTLILKKETALRCTGGATLRA
jgi:hypothetical protein